MQDRFLEQNHVLLSLHWTESDAELMFLNPRNGAKLGSIQFFFSFLHSVVLKVQWDEFEFVFSYFPLEKEQKNRTHTKLPAVQTVWDSCHKRLQF